LQSEDELYRIGTIAMLTGIAVERLRAWERRYGLVPAFRSGKTRFYSKAQLEQLSLIKRLIDQGHPISTLAGLDVEQLTARLETRRMARQKPARAGLVGPNLLVLELAQGDASRLEVCGRWANVEAFLADPAAAGELEVAVIQFPVLLVHQVERVRATIPQTRIVAVYQFATPKHLAAVQSLGIPALAWPAAWTEIEYACATSAGMPLRAARAAARRFTDEELVAIAASATDPHRCPQHLVELISALNAFAEYARSCAEAEEGDVARYDRVHTDTTQARAQLELALLALVEAEELLTTLN
jgi:MerR family transcriptional regulator, light-induced transcriptional regulator